MLWYLMRKEWLLLGRDWHGLALLFLMPTLFILVMSLALRDQFADHNQLQLEYAAVDRAENADSRALLEELAADRAFVRRDAQAEVALLREQVAEDRLRFLVEIEPGFLDRALRGEPGLHISVAPATSPALAELFAARLREALAGLLLAELSAIEGVPDLDSDKIGASVESAYLGTDGVRVVPSAVQQNVPAWLLFAMFFIAIPLSTTVIRERHNGTLARLATMGVPRPLMLLGKLIPYVGVNVVQALLMVAVGLWLVPLLGGDALVLGDAWGGLSLLVLASSLAAVSYALLIAEVAETTEQATLLAGVSNILLAAVGGIMVPRFVMPETMQALGLLSPMAWGLDGFLDLLLRGGNLSQAWPEITALLVFALSMGLAATGLANRRQL